ncbi:hypothetical protein V8F20_007928 [Naviculisporaceae sp. PSN 640]
MAVDSTNGPTSFLSLLLHRHILIPLLLNLFDSTASPKPLDQPPRPDPPFPLHRHISFGTRARRSSAMPFTLTPAHISSIAEGILTRTPTGEKVKPTNPNLDVFVYNPAWAANLGLDLNLKEYRRFIETCFNITAAARMEEYYGSRSVDLKFGDFGQDVFLRFRDKNANSGIVDNLRGKLLKDWVAALCTAVQKHMRKSNDNNPHNIAMDARLIVASKFLIDQYHRWPPSNAYPVDMMKDPIREILTEASGWQPKELNLKFDCDRYWCGTDVPPRGNRNGGRMERHSRR